jgi:hypothetical protein
LIHPDNELRISKHLEDVSYYLKLPNLESRSFFLNQAHEMHALCVWDALRELIVPVISLASIAEPTAAHEYLRYGLGRRVRSIWLAYRNFHATVPPNRTQPLSVDDATEVSNDLNAIYINIRGALDNFAWCLQYAFVGAASKANDIGLFYDRFLGQPEMPDLRSLISEFKDWDKEFKLKRDPAAHRIPLSVIPAIHTSLSLQEFQAVEDQISSKLRLASQEAAAKNYDVSQRLFDEVKHLRKKQERIGSFYPKFEFDPAMGPIDVYPTLPEDLGVFVVISRRLLFLLKQKFEVSNE